MKGFGDIYRATDEFYNIAQKLSQSNIKPPNPVLQPKEYRHYVEELVYSLVADGENPFRLAGGFDVGGTDAGSNAHETRLHHDTIRIALHSLMNKGLIEQDLENGYRAVNPIKTAQDVMNKSKAVPKAQQNFATNDTIKTPTNDTERTNQLAALNAAAVMYNTILTAFNQGGMNPLDAAVSGGNSLAQEKVVAATNLMKSSLPTIENALNKMKNILSTLK